MNLTISLEDDLVEKVTQIAVERDTTLTGMVREYLESVAAESADSDRKRRERELLHETFRKFRGKLGKKTWTRDDLYDL